MSEQGGALGKGPSAVPWQRCVPCAHRDQQVNILFHMGSIRSSKQPRETLVQGGAPGRSRRLRRGGGATGGAEPGLPAAAGRGQRSGGMQQCRAAGLAGLAAVLLGARGCCRQGWGFGVPGLRSPLSIRLLSDLVHLSPFYWRKGIF